MTENATAPPSPQPRRNAAFDAGELFAAALEGNRHALARLLSAVERGGDAARATAALAYRPGPEAQTVGITGPPGAGKSTLVNCLLSVARGTGAGPLAVLAVDPSSPFSGGAILGDRVRMQEHALDEGVFIRSMASRGHLGGLAVAVPAAARVLASVGFPVVLIETVGVGQVEFEVASATDTTVVVVNPRWGDAIQANKAGLLETADVFVINKSDMPGARETKRDLEQMLDLSTPVGWRPPIVETIAAKGTGVEELWEVIGRHRDYQAAEGTLDSRRRQRLQREFRNVLVARIEDEVDRLCDDSRFARLADDVVERKIDPFRAADELIEHVGDAEESRSRRNN
jgi:LAO/AO transport system kinase